MPTPFRVAASGPSHISQIATRQALPYSNYAGWTETASGPNKLSIVFSLAAEGATHTGVSIFGGSVTEAQGQHTKQASVYIDGGVTSQGRELSIWTLPVPNGAQQYMTIRHYGTSPTAYGHGGWIAGVMSATDLNAPFRIAPTTASGTGTAASMSVTDLAPTETAITCLTVRTNSARTRTSGNAFGSDQNEGTNMLTLSAALTPGSAGASSTRGWTWTGDAIWASVQVILQGVLLTADADDSDTWPWPAGVVREPAPVDAPPAQPAGPTRQITRADYTGTVLEVPAERGSLSTPRSFVITDRTIPEAGGPTFARKGQAWPPLPV